MRRRNGNNFFFLGIFIIPALIGGGLALILPIVVAALAGFFIIKMLNNKQEEKDYRKEYTTTVKRNENTETTVRNGDINRIDNKLIKYFKNNISLNIIDDIALTVGSGKFTTTDQLFVTYKDEKIMKLIEFKNKYPDTYNQIISLLLEFAKQKDEVVKQDDNKKESKEENVFSDNDKYIDKINKLNEAIPQEEITNGLYLTCDLLKQIDVLSETHNDEKKTRKLYDYYLPILIDVLEKYKKLQDSPSRGEEFKNCETQLIKTIVLINEALKAICSSMQEDDYMNINADINTLQSLLKKDGYGEDPFGEKK